jgi:hypothetical protein
MKPKYLLIVAVLFLTSCFSSKQTNICFGDSVNKYTSCSDSKTQYFPFSVSHPFYNQNKDEIELSTYLIKVDSSLKVERKNITLYLLKGIDTIQLQEVVKFDRYSYPNIVNEPELYIHFDYTVMKKSDSSIKEVKEDFKLFRCKRTFRSVH